LPENTVAMPSTACFFQELIIVWWTAVPGGKLRHRQLSPAIATPGRP
jgi:hypothetical protein